MTATLPDLSNDLSTAEARQIVDTISNGVAAVWTLVTQAFQGRAWIALGYESWDALCEAEFRSARLRLPREERQEIVASLRAEGMSTRAIGSAVGANNATVHRDLAGVANATPEPERASASAALAKVTETTKTEYQVDTDTGEVVAPTVTGLDGKSYSPARPSMRDINARTSPELKAEFKADADRGVALLRITDACNDLVKITNPEQVAVEAPDYYTADTADSVAPAISILTRFLTTWSAR